MAETQNNQKKPVGRPPRMIPGIPDSFKNVVKAVVRTQPKPSKPKP